MNELSPQRAAKMLRILYPFWVGTGVLSLIYIPSVIGGESGTITAEAIISHERLFRLSILGSLLTQVFFVLIPLLLFWLFKPVNTFQSALLLAFALVSVPITMYNELHQLSALDSLDIPERVSELLSTNRQGLTISFIFWGLWLIPFGTLVYQSGYFPRILSVLLYLGGAGYLLAAGVRILAPDQEPLLKIADLLTTGEILFILWFVIVGPRWNKKKQPSPSES